METTGSNPGRPGKLVSVRYVAGHSKKPGDCGRASAHKIHSYQSQSLKGSDGANRVSAGFLSALKAACRAFVSNAVNLSGCLRKHHNVYYRRQPQKT